MKDWIAAFSVGLSSFQFSALAWPLISYSYSWAKRKYDTALSFTPPGGSAATTFSLTPSVPRLVLLPSTADYVVAESDTIAIDLVSVAADANLFGVTATLADLF